MARYVQPSLFGNLAFLNRKKRKVKTGGQTFTTGDYRTHDQPPLGIVYLASRGAHGKLRRKRAG